MLSVRSGRIAARISTTKRARFHLVSLTDPAGSLRALSRGTDRQYDAFTFGNPIRRRAGTPFTSFIPDFSSHSRGSVANRSGSCAAPASPNIIRSLQRPAGIKHHFGMRPANAPVPDRSHKSAPACSGPISRMTTRIRNAWNILRPARRTEVWRAVGQGGFALFKTR